MNILIIGSGAREHALAKSFKRSATPTNLFCFGANENPGIKSLCVDYFSGDITSKIDVVNKAKAWQIDFAIIGPEAPLEKGISDALWQAQIPTIGPKQNLAKIETSKSFTRNLIKKYHIPGAVPYRVFSDAFSAKDYLEQLGHNKYVIKANGLMGGKGVKLGGEHLHTVSQAYEYCQYIVEQNQEIVIEEKLIGQEFSLMCFCDGYRAIPMPLVQDHKRAYNNDEGPNTGGMGSYSNANHGLPFLSDKDIESANKINQAVLTALTAEFKEPYIGILYGSFMATKKETQIIEFNARFGDPEVLNVLAILESDFVDICMSMLAGNLAPHKVTFANKATVCKYAVPEGYPDHPVKDVTIDIKTVQNTDQIYLGAVNDSNGELYATGSRAVAVVGIADTIVAAEQIAETEISAVHGPLFHREDIGTKELINKRIQQMQLLRQRDYRLL